MAEALARHSSGLMVPSALADRAVIVLTKDQTKLLARCIAQVMGPAGLKFDLACQHDGCPDPTIVRLRTARGFVLRCGHADRILETAF